MTWNQTYYYQWQDYHNHTVLLTSHPTHSPGDCWRIWQFSWCRSGMRALSSSGRSDSQISRIQGKSYHGSVPSGPFQQRESPHIISQPSLTWNLTRSSMAVSCSIKRVSCKVKLLLTGLSRGDSRSSKDPSRSFQTWAFKCSLKVSCGWDWSWKCTRWQLFSKERYFKFLRRFEEKGNKFSHKNQPEIYIRREKDRLLKFLFSGLCLDLQLRPLSAFIISERSHNMNVRVLLRTDIFASFTSLQLSLCEPCLSLSLSPRAE